MPRFAFTTTIYDDTLTSYKYRSCSADYRPRGTFEESGAVHYEEILTTRKEINDLIDELESVKI